jgi:hypothetical protein
MRRRPAVTLTKPSDGRPVLIKEPKLVLNDDNAASLKVSI